MKRSLINLILYWIFFNELVLSTVIKHINMIVTPNKIYLSHIYLFYHISPLKNNKLICLPKIH